MKPIGAKSEEALRAAMARLLTGRPQRTDGKLTVANLAREAGVSRATANRATAVLAAFHAAEPRFKAGTAVSLKARIKELEAELRAVRGGEIALVRADNHTLAQQIQAQALLLAARDRIIDGLKSELVRTGGSNIVPFPRG
ncbi:hypothetical protein [Tardiphaga sp.]|uniref:hypothetical protein n=1 Tax=Tardiphaga sp. TaxID=1926292 RepID=UPI003529FD84